MCVSSPSFLHGPRDFSFALNCTGIVHRDLKPQNVLLTQTRDGLRAKLSDMGISKILGDNQSSFDTLHSGGSIGWQSAEVLKNGRMSKSIDMFSLGCIMYYVITGAHPFGTRFERESNIINNRLVPPSSSSFRVPAVCFYANYSGYLMQSDITHATGHRLMR